MKGAPPPFLSFLLDASGSDTAAVLRTVRSLSKQDDQAWELVVTRAAPELSDRLADERVRVLAESGSSAPGASHEAWTQARGVFGARIDPGGVVAPEAVSGIRAAATAEPETDVVCTWEHRSGDERRRPVLKPRWSPTRLCGHDWTGRLTALRVAVVREVLDVGPLTAAHEHDLALRVVERAGGFELVERSLYVGAERQISDDEWQGSVEAVAARHRRAGLDATVARGPVPGTVRSRIELPPQLSVAVVVPTDGRRGLVWGEWSRPVTLAVRSVLEHAGHPVEVVVVHTEDTPGEVLDALRGLGEQIRLVPAAGPFDHVRLANLGVLSSAAEIVVVVDQHAELDSPRFVPTLLAPLLDGGVGLCAPKVVRGGAVLDGGLVMVRNRVTEVLAGHPDAEADPDGLLAVDREVTALDGTCLALRRTTYVDVGGLSPRFPESYGLDLSGKVARAGRRRVWVSGARVRLWTTLPRLMDRDDSERGNPSRRWVGEDHDPYLPHTGVARGPESGAGVPARGRGQRKLLL